MRDFCQMWWLCLVLLSGAVDACPNLSESKAIEEGESERREAVDRVRELWSEADFVGIVRVATVTKRSLPAASSYANTVGDAETGEGVYVMEAEMEPIQVFKGSAPATLLGSYSRDENLIRIGCSLLLHFETVELDESYRYLIYLKEGKVLRASMIVDWFDGLHSGDEIGVLNNLGGKK